MRAPKPVTVFAFFLLLPQLTGCYTLAPVGAGLSQSLEEAETSRITRVTLTDLREVRLLGAWSDGEFIHGEDIRGRQSQKIPLLSIFKIEERHFSLTRTALATLGVTLGLSLALFGVAVAIGPRT